MRKSGAGGRSLIMAAGALALTATLALAACSAQTGGMTGGPDTGEGTRSGADANTGSGADVGRDTGAGVYHKITAKEAKALIDEGGVTVVDVRTPEEYADGHVPGALNIPNEDIGSTPPPQLTSTDDTLIVYYRTGVRSKQASDKLVSLGFADVNDMGGIVDWPYGTVAGSAPDGA